ncbi:uncharacterized protein LOC127246894 isoform X2 [Andrographis paniculata]|uniref:uncharacterized protein LOC127246894 isoform X2 n=1 Tax=Andrographis paniculata TaxID=175694 RepID=UPI0021E8AA4E|nr:uncharacterized protein LOC127246894 isoform X2 [Andrographis paniculata]
MDSAGFELQDKSRIVGTSNGKKCKLPRTLADNRDAVYHASVPRKLRSVKKRDTKSVTPNLPISRKQRHESNGFQSLRNNGGKRSKSNMKKVNITKDEEEVAEALYTLADMFSAANPDIKASPTLHAVQDDEIVASQDESLEIGPVNLENKVIESQTVSDAQQPESPANKQPAAASSASGSESENLNPRLPESRNTSSLQLSIENKIAAEKLATAQAPVETKKSRKGCSVHVYISWLIKDLVVSDGKERLLKKPTQIETFGDAETATRAINCNETTGTHCCGASENESAKIQIGIHSDKSTLKDHQHQVADESSASCSSTYHGGLLPFPGYDFIFLGSGVRGLNTGEGMGTRTHEARNQFQAPRNILPQSNAPLHFSPSQNGYSAAFQGHYSSFATPEAQLPPQYPGATIRNSFIAQLRQQQQQRWVGPEVPTQYNSVGAGAGSLQLPDWRNGRTENVSTMSNYTHSLYPHLQPSFSSKYHQQFSHPQP